MSDNWYTDYAQNKRIRGLEEDLSHVSSSLASARSAQRRLRAELSKVQGTLEQRLDRLSAAFDAFVEISDLRVTLGLFDAQGRIRHQARQLLRGEAITGVVSDVEGYWLAPAFVALRAAARGAGDSGSAAAAKELDALRATVFHVLGAGLLGGRETVSAEMLADTLPVPEASLPIPHRAVWTLAADGFFGETGWELVRRRGVEFVRGLADDGPAVETIRKIGTAAAESVPLPRHFEGASELATALDAAARLAALRAWVDESLAGWRNEQAGEVDPVVRRCVELLVDEGSPEELPLLARERELRAVIESDGGEPVAWDGPAGDTLDLIHADASDSEHPGRRAVAVRICGAHVLTAAERLAETARLPFPERVRARTRQGAVTITRRGVESLEAAHRRIEVSARVQNDRRYLAYGSLAVAVVFLVLTFAAGWGWVICAFAALGTAAVAWRRDVQTRAEAVRNAQSARAALAEEVDQRVAQLAECRSALTERQSSIDEHLAALRAALA